MKILFFIISAVTCFMISSTIHELGHILGGLKEGFKFHLFVAGPFGFKRNEEGKVTFYIEKDFSLWGGVSATMPEDESPDNFKRFGHVLLWGPAASIIFGTIWLPLGIITNNVFLSLLGAMPIAMGTACLIPSRSGVFYSDGARWLRMHKDEATKAVEIAVWELTQNAIIHGDYAKASLNHINVLTSDSDMRTNYLGHYYAYCYYKDNNDIANAEKEKSELEKLKEKIPKQVVSMFNVN